MRMVSVDKLWRLYRWDRCWCTSAGDIFPQNLLQGQGREHPDFDKHKRSIEFWRQIYKTFVGREQEMPEDYYIVRDPDGTIIDGYHRLVAAKMVGLQLLPFVIGDWEGVDYE